VEKLQAKDRSHPGRIVTAHVVANQPLCRDHYKLVMAAPGFGSAQPGQFVQVQCGQPGGAARIGTSASADLADIVRQGWPPLSGTGLLLRRPFSIAGLRRDDQGCRIELIHRVVGRGTAWLASRRPGDPISLLGPLGRPFSIVEDRPMAYLVCGGVGVSPMPWLAETLQRAGKQVLAFCGARTAELLPLSLEPGAGRASMALSPERTAREFAASGTPVILASDDGTIGWAGTIAAALTAYHRAHPVPADRLVVYACGPEAMLKALAAFCRGHGIPCQVSLERRMACGTGTCQSCVVRVHEPSDPDGWAYRLCCTDGPVFDAAAVHW